MWTYVLRYVTRASAMPVYAMSTFVRGRLVPGGDADPSSTPTRCIDPRSAPPTCALCAWSFDDPQTEADAWAEETLAAIRGAGAEGSVLAVDRLGTAWTWRSRRGVTIRDSAPVTQEARRIRTLRNWLLPTRW